MSWRDSGAEQFTAGRSKFDVGIDWTTAARLALPPSRYFGIATPTRCRLCASYHGHAASISFFLSFFFLSLFLFYVTVFQFSHSLLYS